MLLGSQLMVIKKIKNLRCPTIYDFKKIEGAGHWLHAEKPKEFVYFIKQFLNN